MSIVTLKNYLTIDIEEWYQTILFDKKYRLYKNVRTTKLPENVNDILILLDKYNTKATFFIVGSVAEKYPEVVRAIAKKGHEIASHGYNHMLVWDMSKDEFVKDAERSVSALRKISGNAILGYRASTWSMTKDMPWALDTLKTLGLKYDSSIYPVSLNLLDCPRLKRFPHEVKDDFFEFPPSVFKLLGYNLPFAGGIFLRFFPINFISKMITQLNMLGHPAMVYSHSWEFGSPEEKMPYWKYAFQYKNTVSAVKKIEILLKRFNFGPIKEHLKI